MSHIKGSLQRKSFWVEKGITQSREKNQLSPQGGKLVPALFPLVAHRGQVLISLM